MSMFWFNSPGNPDGHMFGAECLWATLTQTRERGVMITSDECYAGFTWDIPEAPSILDGRVCDGSVVGLLCLYSLSKQSNVADYRVTFLADDPAMIGSITEIRRHAGFLMPGLAQTAMTRALGDDARVAGQRTVHARRRKKLLAVLDATGLVNNPLSMVGLYTWIAVKRPVGGVAGSNHDGDSVVEAPTGWGIVRACARLGIVVAPDDFYGKAGRNRVQISPTATDPATDETVCRLPRLPEALRRGQLQRASDRLAATKGLLRYLLSLRRTPDEESGLSR